MAIDYGDDILAQWIKKGYIKTSSQGIVFTAKGFSEIITCLQELYNQIKELKEEINETKFSSNSTDDISTNGHDSGSEV